MRIETLLLVFLSSMTLAACGGDDAGDVQCTLECAQGECLVLDGAPPCVCSEGYAGTLCDACASGLQDNDGDGRCSDDCVRAAPACVHGACVDSSGTALCEGTGGYAGEFCDDCPESMQDNDNDGVCTADCGSAALARRPIVFSKRTARIRGPTRNSRGPLVQSAALSMAKPGRGTKVRGGELGGTGRSTCR